MNEKKEFPFVSVILVTHNEQEYVRDALLSLINQTYPKDKYEIIIVDGMSSDKTLDIVSELIEIYSSNLFAIKVIRNEKKILAAGWNLGIKQSKGKYVVRIDAHAKANNNFLMKNVETMLRISDVVCVGGKLKTEVSKDSNGIVSKVLSSPFGVGNSSFRVSDVEGYADTAVYGLYKKEIFEKIGYFDERYIRNQDIELHSRIKKIGGKFYFNPQISCTYYARNTVKKMCRQAYGNGKWNMVLLKNHKSALSLRHLIPFVFVIFLLTTFVGGFFNNNIWKLEIAVVILHMILGIIAASKKTSMIYEIIQMPFLFLALHISYGCGYFSGLLINNIKEK